MESSSRFGKSRQIKLIGSYIKNKLLTVQTVHWATGKFSWQEAQKTPHKHKYFMPNAKQIKHNLSLKGNKVTASLT